MRTLGTTFEQYRDRADAERNYVLSLTDGSSTWYFSSRAIALTDGECYPFLTSSFSSTEGFNIYTRRWKTPTCRLTISNEQMELNDDNTWSRPSDILTGIRYRDAVLYVSVGPEIDTLSDMEIIFSGLVAEAPNCSTSTVNIQLTDRGFLYDTDLPNVLVGDEFSGAPSASASQYIPLVYGDFNFDDTDWDYSGTGMAKAVQTTPQGTAFVVSDHALDAITELWAGDERIEGPARVVTRTLTASDGNGRGVATAVGKIVETVLYPSTEDGCEDYDDEPGEQLDADNAIDRDTTTSVKLTNNLTMGSDPGVNPEGILLMSFAEDSFLWDIAERGGDFKMSQWTTDDLSTTKLSEKLRLYYYASPDQYIEENLTTSGDWHDSASYVAIPRWYRYIEDTVFTGSGLDDATGAGTFTGYDTHTYTVQISVTGTPDSFVWAKDDGAFSGNIGITGAVQNLSEGVTITFAATTGHTVDDKWVITARKEDKNANYAIAIYIGGKASDANGWLDFTNVFGLRLILKYGLSRSAGHWAACKGREFGDWITSRSDEYSAGVCIEDPVQITHSVLRDILGLGDTRIDYDSFDDAENTNVTARLNLHSDNRLSVYEIMRQLAEQSTYAIYWTAAGKARAVTLNEKTPTADRTFCWEDMVPDSLKVSNSDGVINSLMFRSRYQQEYDIFRDVDTKEDGTSQTTYDGTYAYEAKWPNICGTSATHVADWLVNTTDGVWSKDHYAIEFATPGYKDIDLQCGDYVAMDETSVGAHLHCKGEAWTSKVFMIHEITYKHDSIKFEAIKLY